MQQLPFKSHWPYFLLIFVLLLLGFLPIITQVYVFHDDLSFWMYPSHHEPHPQFELLMYSGRYLGALIYNLDSLLITSLIDLNKIRTVSFLILFLCSLGSYKLLYGYLKNSLHAALVTVAIFSLPAFEVMADWASGSFHPFAIAFSLLAILAANQIPVHTKFKDRLLNHSSLISIICMFIANLFYPPAATFYWPMAAIIFLTESNHSPNTYKAKLINIYTVGLLGIGLYAATLKFIGAFFKFSAKSAYEPQKFVTDIPGKLIWFYKTFSTQILNLWNIFPGKIIPIVIILLVLGALLIRFSKRQRFSILSLAVIVSLIILSYLPNLLTVMNLNVYRCTAGIMTLTLLAVIWSLQTYFESIAPSKRKLLSFILALLALYGVASSYYNIYNFRVRMCQLEFNLVKDAIVNFKGKPKWIIITPPKVDEFYHYYDEFGGLSSFWREDLISLLNCVFNEIATEGNMDWVGFSFDSKTNHLHYALQDRSTLSYHTIDLQVVLSDTPITNFPHPAIVINFKDLYPQIQKIMGQHYYFKSAL